MFRTKVPDKSERNFIPSAVFPCVQVNTAEFLQHAFVNFFVLNFFTK
jgi:hypothetical protein